MKMVSAAKLRRAQDAIESARPYAARMRATLQEVGAAEAGSSHPLFEERETIAKAEVGGDHVRSGPGWGIQFPDHEGSGAPCLRNGRRMESKRALPSWARKASEYFLRHRPSQISEDRAVGPKVNYLEAQQIAQRLMSDFESGEVDRVVLLHNEFISAMTQTPKIVPLLPFVPERADSDAEGGRRTPPLMRSSRAPKSCWPRLSRKRSKWRSFGRCLKIKPGSMRLV